MTNSDVSTQGLRLNACKNMSMSMMSACARVFSALPHGCSPTMPQNSNNNYTNDKDNCATYNKTGMKGAVLHHTRPQAAAMSNDMCNIDAHAVMICVRTFRKS
jgi:hypothetical protein